jgi:hypothetical protein
LPSTSIEDTVWATAGDDTSVNIVRAANKPPRTRIPTFMRNPPSSFRAPRTVGMWLKNLRNVSDRSKMLLDGD